MRAPIWQGCRSVSVEEAPAACEMFQKKQDGCIKVTLKP